MGVVSQIDLGLGRPAGTARFECKTCGRQYQLDRQMCLECDSHCIGYRQSWLDERLNDDTARESRV